MVLHMKHSVIQYESKSNPDDSVWPSPVADYLVILRNGRFKISHDTTVFKDYLTLVNSSRYCRSLT